MYDFEAKKEFLNEQILFEAVFKDLFPQRWTRSGSNQRCPFHEDKTPSFKIYEDGNKDYCFSCKKDWDIFGLIMEYEQCDLPEAISKLETMYSIYRPEYLEELKATSKQFSFSNLNHILYNRGVLDEINKLIQSQRIESDGTTIVVPICSITDQVIGKQEINLLEDKQNRYKFQNKSKVKDGVFIINPDGTMIVVVESFLDALSVAKMLPDHQIITVFSADGKKVSRLFKDSTNEIILFFDNDGPGHKATKDATGFMLQTIKTVDWSIAENKGKDVNELLINAPDLINKMIANAQAITPFGDVFTAQYLLSSDLPEPSFIVDGLLPVGLSLLSGKPKKGKSYMCVNIGTSCATGSKVLGHIPTEKQEVLYLALEDTHIRLKNRLMQSVPDATGLDNLHIKTNWPRIGEGGEEQLELWLQHYPGTKLIIIDTLEKITSSKSKFSSKGLYSDDYAKIEPLKNIADNNGIAILCIHHLNKRDSDNDIIDLVSGSTGLTGAVDTIIILSRDIKRVDAKLYISGRDIEEAELGIDFDKINGKWTIKGNAKDFELPEELNKVYQIINESGSSKSPSDIMFEFNKKGDCKSLSTIQTQLNQLVEKGRIYKKSRGQYIVTDFAE